MREDRPSVTSHAVLADILPIPLLSRRRCAARAKHAAAAS